MGITNGMKVSETEALEIGEKFLGKGYKEIGNGRFVSEDGTRVFRMGNNDITGKHGGGPHVNLETLIENPNKPGKMKVETNIHVYRVH